MRRRYLSYGAGIALLLSVVLFGVGTEERRYESVVARLKGIVIDKEMHRHRARWAYGVTYRVTVQGQVLQREGDVGSRTLWDSIRIGQEIDVESVGVTANETRLPAERLAGSAVYFGISAALAIAGAVLIVLRLRAPAKA
jgi:hypothetical protein